MVVADRFHGGGVPDKILSLGGVGAMACVSGATGLVRSMRGDERRGDAALSMVMESRATEENERPCVVAHRVQAAQDLKFKFGVGILSNGGFR